MWLMRRDSLGNRLPSSMLLERWWKNPLDVGLGRHVQSGMVGDTGQKQESFLPRLLCLCESYQVCHVVEIE